VIDAESPAPGIDDASGLGYVTQSFFFSPKEPIGGWIVGVGPVFYWPTATDSQLGGDLWGAGPTAILLKQEVPFTVGLLASQLWSYAGDNEAGNLNNTFLEPFVSYVTKTHTTFSLNTEFSYDWEHEQWSVPINFQVSQLFSVGKQKIQGFLGGRYYAEGPDGVPEWGIRTGLTFLFPE
jgi:hypothetical protein